MKRQVEKRVMTTCVQISLREMLNICKETCRDGLIFPAILVCLTLICSGSLMGSEVSGLDTGLVHSVVKAPIVPDGNVAGAVTDFVINLSGSMDPEVAGRALLAGRRFHG